MKQVQKEKIINQHKSRLNRVMAKFERDADFSNYVSSLWDAQQNDRETIDKVFMAVYLVAFWDRFDVPWITNRHIALMEMEGKRP